MWDGALILTAEGQVSVEDLAPGAIIKTASGETRRILAIEAQSKDVDASAVRIVAGALGDRHPYKDVDLAPDTLILLKDEVFPARSVVNGTAISAIRRDGRPACAIVIEGPQQDGPGATQAYAPLFHADGFVHADNPFPAEVWDRTPSPETKRRLRDVAASLGFSGTDDSKGDLPDRSAATAASNDGENRAVPSGAPGSGVWNGALVLTLGGQVAAEELAPGAIVKTASGYNRRVISVERRSREDTPLIRIMAGALGDRHPYKDVDLAEDALILLKERVVPVRRIVNEATISSVRLGSGTPAFDIVIEGPETEDDGAPQAYAPLFHADGFVHADTQFPAEVWDRAPSPETKQRLIAVATSLGFTATGNPDLHILAGGHRIEARSTRDSRYIFALPEDADSFRLVSRVWVPAEMLPDSEDERHLGVCVRRLVLDGHELALQDLGAGWDKLEDHGTVKPRWTKGSAVVPLAGHRVVDIELYGVGRYWIAPGTPSQTP